MPILSQDKFDQLKQKAGNLLNRTLDQHVNLAVTGLSRSGKTAFITSLVNQLLSEGGEKHLTFFNPVHQDRFIAAKRVTQKHMHVARFDYDGAMQALSQLPAVWPQATKGISELRLAIKYKPKDSLLKYTTELATLTLDITDYPGEWLLDLSMLNMTYEQWSEQMHTLLTREPRAELAKAWMEKISQLDPLKAADELEIAELAKAYTELLHTFRHQLGLSVIQPGRFILPGELAGAPILEFFPFTEINKLDGNAYQNADDTSVIGMLKARFLEYRERVVKQFYKKHFLKFDRQIVLADCLTPLNNGKTSFEDLKLAMSMIMQSYHYGQSSLFSRLFNPKIDKLMFAATKADHVTPEQHTNLVSLVNQLVHGTKQEISFNAIDIKSLAIASIKSTNYGNGTYQGQSIPVVRGLAQASGKLTTLFPGAVPAKLPKDNYWQSHPFNFVNFAPTQGVAEHEALPHLRMDQVLQFLLGDKMS
ncbi:YcjX family protein [Thalassotalea euphylliae]|uniref:YcjX family protein n=1 Tax=Thalassotalea euphylliae TaxID=1655234 RepID=A0A3E0TSS0_9GAMM|nr:YcjX family protein [Thalassotalea euphylliae]REL27588.1 YcjX family protein [Thalassotalea euphylliae]